MKVCCTSPSRYLTKSLAQPVVPALPVFHESHRVNDWYVDLIRHVRTGHRISAFVQLQLGYPYRSHIGSPARMRDGVSDVVHTGLVGIGLVQYRELTQPEGAVGMVA